VGQEVQFQMPTTMGQAVNLALTVENVEKQKQLVGGPKKVFANKMGVKCYKCRQTGHYARDCQWEQSSRDRRKMQMHSYDGGTSHGRDERGNQDHSDRSGGRVSRGVAEKSRYVPEGSRPSGLQCFQCRQFGHLRRECPRLSQRTPHTNGQGSKYRPLTSS
jgi:hypothetical protein